MAMNPALHNRPGQRLSPARQPACHVPRSPFNGPRSPLPSPTHSTTTPIFSLVAPDPKTSPFAAVVASSGPMAKINPIRFSTKWWDEETGLGWWGYRFYDPGTGRWCSRDPMEGPGGVIWLERQRDKLTADNIWHERARDIERQIRRQLNEFGVLPDSETTAQIGLLVRRWVCLERSSQTVSSDEQGVTALYLFVANSPVDLIDLLGLWCQPLFRRGCWTCELCFGSDCPGSGYKGCIRCGRPF